MALPFTVIKTNHSAPFFFGPNSRFSSASASAVSDSCAARGYRRCLLPPPAAGRARLPTRTGHCQELHYSFCFNPLMWIQVAVSVPRLWQGNKWLARGWRWGWGRRTQARGGVPACRPSAAHPAHRPPGSPLWSRPVGKSYFKALCYF